MLKRRLFKIISLKLNRPNFGEMATLKSTFGEFYTQFKRVILQRIAL
jgi:hypothetical protein